MAALAVSAPAQAQTSFINLNTWPVDDQYRALTALPDSPWTWNRLGLVEGMGCPPSGVREFEESKPWWRDEDVPIEQDWAQASNARVVACYRGHRGTDIITPPGAPVYAAGDGVVFRAEESENSQGVVGIDHERLLDDGLFFEWKARYIHLDESRITVQVGERVREGQVIGFVADLDTNTHLHFEITEVSEVNLCQTGACVINPFGPTFLWVDDNFDSRIDHATMVLPDAPSNADLVAGVSRHADDDGILREYIPYRLEGVQRLRVQLQAANMTTTPQTVEVRVDGLQPEAQAARCTLTVPPRTPMQTYTLPLFASGVWENAVVEVGSAWGMVIGQMAVQVGPVDEVGPGIECDTPPEVPGTE